MTQDPKKTPKRQNQPPPSEPPPSEPPPSSPAEDDMPPWLRDEAPAGKIKKVTPPPPEDADAVPPWLQGLEDSKTYKIGGAELSEEYLAAGDQLPDTSDSEMTYDSWMAQQLEDRRVKDIEEEVPDDLLNLIQEDQPVVADTKSTGQLPDWFLGLETLDTSDAPEWFTTDDLPPAPPEAPTPPEPPTPAGMTPWIDDEVTAATPQPEPGPVDEIGSFFSSLPADPIEPVGADDDNDWFTQFQSEHETPLTPPSPAPTLPDLPDIDDFPEEDELPPDLGIPQTELDAFFDNVAAARPPSTEDIEEPDLDWLRAETPAEAAPPAPPEPEVTVAPSEDTLSWLSQLQNIVSSASSQTGPLTPPPPARPERRDPLADDVGAEPAAFEWPEMDYEEPAAPDEEPAAPAEVDWLSDIAPTGEMTIRTTLPEEMPDPPMHSSLLAGRLRRSEPELPAEPVAPAEPEPTPDEASLIPEDELQSGWLTDDLFAEAPAAAGEDDFFSLLQQNADANVLEDSARAQAYPIDDEALAEAEFAGELEPDEPISTDEFYARLGMSGAEPEPAAAADNFALPDAEQPPAAGSYSWDAEDALPGLDDFALPNAEQPAAAESYGWDAEDALPGLDDFALPDAEQPPAAGSYSWDAEDAAAENDFFTRLGGEVAADAAPENDFFTHLSTDRLAADSPDEEPDVWRAEEPAPENDFFTRLGTDPLPDAADDQLPPGRRAEEPAPEDHFFTRLGTDPLPDAADDEPTHDQNAQWELDDAFQEDALFAELNASDEDDQALAEAAEPDDFFAALGLNDEQAQAGSSLEKSDFFDTFGFSDETAAPQTPPVAQDDLFAPWDDQAADDEAMPDDFFAALGMSDGPPASGDDADEEAEEIPDFFTSLDAAEPELPERSTPAMTYSDVDSYLASLSADQPDAPATADDLYKQAASLDLDDLFAEPVMPERAEPSPDAAIPGANADWLAELQTSVGDVSASAIVRQKEDRPVAELSDRLRRLRERGEEVSSAAAAQDEDSALAGSLTPAPFIGVPTDELIGSIALTTEQQRKVDLLKALVPHMERATGPLSAIEATYDSPFVADLEDTPESRVEPEPSQPAPRPRRRKRRRPTYRLDRLLIAVVLAVAVILPFILPAARVGNLPAASFAAGSAAQTAFSAVDAVQPGDLVLIGLEYGPTAAAELDGLADALVRHILLHAAYPVIISGNPLGLLRAQNLFTGINADTAFLARIGAGQPLAANSDYYLIRYLPGSIIGLRAFSQDSANLLLGDIRGQATNLVVRSLREFKLIAVVTDRAEDLRAYAEQVAPLAQAPLVAAVSYGAAPLVEPYAQALGGGLLVGYQDGYTYADALGLVGAQPLAQRVRVIPTDTPTPTPTATQTLTPTITLTPSKTRTPLTSTPLLPTPTVVLGTGTVIARQAVNMRSGPSTDSEILAAVPSGTTLIALSYNDDHTWVNVRLTDGREGWISAALLSISTEQSALPKTNAHAKRQAVDEGQGRATRTPRPTVVPPTPTPVPPTATQPPSSATEVLPTFAAPTAVPATAVPPTATRIPPTATLAPTATPTPAATAEATEAAAPVVGTPVPAGTPAPPSPGYRDERWYAMNLGIIASALVITLGMVVNLVRGLLRRGQRG